MSNTKYLSDEIVYQTKFFRIRKMELERNGKKFTKEYLDRQPFVVVLPLNDKNELYLISQYRDVLKKTILEAVAGIIEENEDPMEAAKRELQEETGLTASNWKRIATWELNVNMNCKVFVYVATGLTEGIAHKEDDEEIELVKMPFENAVEKAINGDTPAASHVAAILLVDKLIKEGKL